MKSNKIPAALTLIILALFIMTQQPRSLARGLDRILGTSTCNLLVLPNDGGTSQNARCPMTRFRFARTVYLITANELAAAGYQNGSTPSSIGWTYDTAPAVSGSAPLIIYMQNTADTTNTKSTTWATAISGMTTVHNATTTLPAAAGEFDVTFSGGSPFTYTGGGLYVAFDWGQYTGTLSTTAVALCNSTGLAGGLLGQQSNTAAPTTLVASNFRPETRLRGNAFPNDASADALYSYGELPLGLVPPQMLQGVVSNKGANVLNNLPVMLNITGANPFSDTKNIASIASCTGTGSATFAPYTPMALGTDTVTVSVPADDNNTNNSVSHPTSVTQLSYSYKYPGSTATGGVGLTGATGAFVGKFTITAANAVTDVKLEFPAPVTAGAAYRVAIYGDNAGIPSTTALYVDSTDRTPVAGPVVITLPSPVAVPAGNFYVGIQQTNTTNAGLSFDDEAPIRSGSFFFASPLPVTSWLDFAPGNNFKLNVGVNLQTPGGAVPTPSAVVSRKVHGAAGTFDVNLPLAGTGIEPRASAGGVYQMVFTFPTPVTFTGASVTAGPGMVTSSSGSGTATVTVNLSGLVSTQRTTVTLANVNGAGNVSVQMGVLIGDDNGNGSVNAGDVSLAKSRIGQILDATNFKSDINANGTINAGDVSQIKVNIGTGLP